MSTAESCRSVRGNGDHFQASVKSRKAIPTHFPRGKAVLSVESNAPVALLQPLPLKLAVTPASLQARVALHVRDRSPQRSCHFYEERTSPLATWNSEQGPRQSASGARVPAAHPTGYNPRRTPAS